MTGKSLFITSTEAQIENARNWELFLQKNKFDFTTIEKIDMSKAGPVIIDKAGNKFSINFSDDKKNYSKKKASIKSELISKALGAGKQGLNILDLSAGLGIDAVFLAQLGYSVTALERNPLIYLALNEAIQLFPDLSLKFLFSDALEYLKHSEVKANVIYFDPMFPDKAKSALPRQEMVFFRNLVGHDEDALKVLEVAIRCKGIKRVVVKRPIKAPALLKPMSSTSGKLIRFDIYGVKP